MDLKKIITDAHMAGQRNQGVDASWSEAHAYYSEFMKEQVGNVAKPDACPQLAEVTVAEKELIIAALNYLKNNTYSLREIGTVEDKVSPIIKKLMKD